MGSLLLKIAVVFIALFQFHSAVGTPSINYLVANATTIPKYDKFELTFDIGGLGAGINPYNPNDINVYAEFYSPSNKYYKVYGFYYNGVTQSCVNGVEQITLTASKRWKIRFTPNETGSWTYRISATDQTGTVVYPSASTFNSFNVIGSSNHGFIVKANNRYLKYEDNTPYYPIGNNAPWFNRNIWRGPLEYGTCEMKTWIDQMAANKMNFFLLEINFFDGLSLIGYDHTDQKNYFAYFNQKDAWQLDEIITYANSKGINIELALFSHATLGDDGPGYNGNSGYCEGNWSQYNPFNANINPAKAPQAPDAAGTCQTPFEFHSNAQAISMQKRLLRYIIARWGYATNILAFELMDEADRLPAMNQSLTPPGSLNQNIIDWHLDLKNYITATDPFRHLISTTFATKDYNQHVTINSAMDFTQPKTYTNLVTWQGNFEHDNFTIQKGFVDKYNKPTIISEFGYFEANPALYQQYDPKMYGLHCTLWSTMFSGAFGGASFWTHDDIENINVANLSNYTGIGEFTRQLPILSETFLPYEIIDSYYRMYYLKNNNGDKYYGWIQDKSFSIRNILDHYPGYLQNLTQNRPPLSSTNNPIYLSVSKNGIYDVKWYNTETGSLYMSETLSASYNVLAVTMPGWLKNGKYADAGFSIVYRCDGQWNTAMLSPTAPSNVHYGNDIDTDSYGKVYFAGFDGRIHQYYWNGIQWIEATLNVNAPANVSPASDIAIDDLDKIHFIGTDNRVHQYYWNGSQYVEATLNPNAPANVRAFSPLATDHLNKVYFIGTDNRVHQYYWNGSQYMEATLNPNAPANVREDSDLAVDNMNKIYFVATDNRVHQYYWDGGQYVEATLNVNAPANVRYNSSLTTDHMNKVYFIGNDHRVHQYYWNGSQYMEATLNANAPANVKANSDLTSDHNGKIYFIGADSRIHQYYWNGSAWVESINNINDPQNAVRYLASHEGNVFYTADDYKIYASYWGCQSFFKNAGSENHHENHVINLFPNPSKGLVRVELPGLLQTTVKIDVLDITGRSLLTRQITNEKAVDLDLSDYTRGIYFFKISGNGQSVIKKIILN